MQCLQCPVGRGPPGVHKRLLAATLFEQREALAALRSLTQRLQQGPPARLLGAVGRIGVQGPRCCRRSQPVPGQALVEIGWIVGSNNLTPFLEGVTLHAPVLSWQPTGRNPAEPLVQTPALQAQPLLKRRFVKTADHGLRSSRSRLWLIQGFAGLQRSAVAKLPAQLHRHHRQLGLYAG